MANLVFSTILVLPLCGPRIAWGWTVAAFAFLMIGYLAIEYRQRRRPCPRCGARHARIDDIRIVGGQQHNFPYCGACGRNLRE